MKRWIFGLIFLIVTPIALPLAILLCAVHAWRVTIEHEAEKVIGGLKE